MKLATLLLASLLLTPSMVARAADPTDVAIDKELKAAIVFHQGILDSITPTASVPKLMLKSHHQSQLKMVRKVLKDGHMLQKLTIAIIELERKIEFSKSLILHAPTSTANTPST